MCIHLFPNSSYSTTHLHRSKLRGHWSFTVWGLPTPEPPYLVCPQATDFIPLAVYSKRMLTTCAKSAELLYWATPRDTICIAFLSCCWHRVQWDSVPWTSQQTDLTMDGQYMGTWDGTLADTCSYICSHMSLSFVSIDIVYLFRFICFVLHVCDFFFSHVCLWVACISGARGGQKTTSNPPGTEVMEGFEQVCGCWDSNLDLLQE